MSVVVRDKIIIQASQVLPGTYPRSYTEDMGRRLWNILYWDFSINCVLRKLVYERNIGPAETNIPFPNATTEDRQRATEWVQVWKWAFENMKSLVVAITKARSIDIGDVVLVKKGNKNKRGYYQVRAAPHNPLRVYGPYQDKYLKESPKPKIIRAVNRLCCEKQNIEPDFTGIDYPHWFQQLSDLGFSLRFQFHLVETSVREKVYENWIVFSDFLEEQQDNVRAKHIRAIAEGIKANKSHLFSDTMVLP